MGKSDIKQVYVFGTGKAAERLNNMLVSEGLMVNGFFDNDSAKHSSLFQEKKILNPDKIADFTDNIKCMIFVASMYYQEIAQQLTSLGMTENEDFSNGLAFADFLEQRNEDRVNLWAEYQNWQQSTRDALAPCHYRSLFIKNSGEIYPCCRVWLRDDMKIGHLGEADLDDKIKNFDGHCSCNDYTFRKAEPNEESEHQFFNLELSLACQAKCAMCIVNAPEWRGRYELYKQHETLIDKYQPKELFVQGGEILVQKKSLRWLEHIKEKHPDVRLIAITNGNIHEKKIPKVENLFAGVTITLPSFQALTYQAIAGLDLQQAIIFAEKLAYNGKVELVLKFLITPVNIHELASFFKWSSELSTARILVSDANSTAYCNMKTDDKFWDKIFERSGIKVRKILQTQQHKLNESGTKIYMDRASRMLTGIDD